MQTGIRRYSLHTTYTANAIILCLLLNPKFYGVVWSNQKRENYLVQLLYSLPSVLLSWFIPNPSVLMSHMNKTISTTHCPGPPLKVTSITIAPRQSAVRHLHYRCSQRPHHFHHPPDYKQFNTNIAHINDDHNTQNHHLLI